MRSASALTLTGAAAIALGGCQTTQQKSARAKVGAGRILATQRPLRVLRRNPAVQVVSVNLVRGSGGAAVLVALRNRDARTLTDLPISVWAQAPHGGRRYLNRVAGLGYFQTHVPVLPARGSATWVFETSAAGVVGSAFAAVGLPKADATPARGSLPTIAAHVLAKDGGSDVRAEVLNRTGIDQPQLPIYVVARRGGRYTAGASASIADLAAGASAKVDLKLIGDARGAALTVAAPPSMVR